MSQNVTGTWMCETRGSRKWVIWDEENGEKIASVRRNEADARLITAAPGLLAAARQAEAALRRAGDAATADLLLAQITRADTRYETAPAPQRTAAAPDFAPSLASLATLRTA